MFFNNVATHFKKFLYNVSYLINRFEPRERFSVNLMRVIGNLQSCEPFQSENLNFELCEPF